MKIHLICFALLMSLLSDCALAQSVNTSPKLQDSLSKISSLIWKQKTDNERIAASDKFFYEFNIALKSDTSFACAFDSIFGITRVSSDDDLMRIFTWNVPINDGKNKYYGFIQFKGKGNKLIPLRSVENTDDDIASQQIPVSEWYGALYYKIIPVKIGNKTVYTVLGWDGYTSASNRKFIDIVSTDSEDNINFGMPVFKTAKGIKSRIILEYAENAKLLLRFDYQSIKTQFKKKIKKENTWLIVMDRLVPMDPSMEGNKKYYVPVGNIYDGFIFRNGYWVLVEDVVVKN